MRKSFKILIIAGRITAVICLILFLPVSCTITKEAACPEFPDNRNYSLKYRADYRTNRKYTRNQSSKGSVIKETQIFIITRNTSKFSVDFTINQNALSDYESYRLMPFPNITSDQIQSDR
ncbi:MAG: hypothetical protein AMS27_05530 [Bacteroides sp. SM23_62_1]|nr:MAG: hypothetical protein AMS27_05530 [Bacteroides sp. SM23_62_1]